MEVEGLELFLSNATNGVLGAEIAILVVDGGQGTFEAEISKNRETREYFFLDNVPKIKQLIVLVKKMDDNSVEYSREECIEKFNEKIEQALPGNYVRFIWKGVSVRKLKRGMVCGEAKKEPPKRILFFTAEIMNSPNGIHKGYMPQLKVTRIK